MGGTGPGKEGNSALTGRPHHPPEHSRDVHTMVRIPCQISNLFVQSGALQQSNQSATIWRISYLTEDFYRQAWRHYPARATFKRNLGLPGAPCTVWQPSSDKRLSVHRHLTRSIA